jgi:predicted amidohydrolase
MIVDYKGNDIAAGENGMLLTADLDLEGLRKFRSRFPAWMDADMFKIE